MQIRSIAGAHAPWPRRPVAATYAGHDPPVADRASAPGAAPGTAPVVGVTRYDVVRAFDRHEFHLLYQPQFALVERGEQFAGVEALLRWEHPRHGVIVPPQFLQQVERMGLGRQLGQLVLQTALLQIRRWVARCGASPRVSVNVTSAQIDSVDFASSILDMVETLGIAPQSLTLEIVESPEIIDAMRASAELSRLQQAGVDIAIDDFGTGSATFKYLLHLPFDSIKLCGEFVAGIGNSAGAGEICRAVIRLARSLGKSVLAEGVETRAQLDFLRAERCHQAQGFLLGRPMTGDTVHRRYLAPGALRPSILKSVATTPTHSIP